MELFAFLLFIVFAGPILSIIYTKNRRKSIYSVVSYWADFLIFVAIIAMGVLAIMSMYTKRSRASGYDYVPVTTGLKIDSYTVTLDVDKDYKINVTEDISIVFLDSTHHGIYRFIPDWLEYTDETGKTTSRKARVYDITAEGEPYTIGVVKGKKRIKIGSADKMVPKGRHDYRIKYVYNMDGDMYDGFDEFIFHAFGDYWGTYINNPTVIINLPETVDLDGKIRLFADKRRKEDITSNFDVTVEGNVITAKALNNYALSGALTVDIGLPDGYFNDVAEENYGYASFIMCMICIGFTVVALVIWFFKGKDYTAIETVEFYPPSGLDPSEIGYIYKSDTGRKLTVATIISLASKGAIKIDESADKKIITITKNFEVDFDNAINRIIVLTKLKDFDSDLNVYGEETAKYIKKYFPTNKSKEATVVEDCSLVLDSFKELIDKGFIKVKNDTINDYTEEAIENIKKYIEDKNSNKVEFTKNEKVVFNALFEGGDTVNLKEHKTLYNVFSSVSENVKEKYDDLVHEVSSYKWSIIVCLWLIICIGLWGAAYVIVKDLNPKFSFLYTIAYAANAISLGLTILMRRRTVYGENLLGSIKGFRNYLETVEKDKIEMLVEENPNYFYDILPFAYVLDVSSKWIKKFEDIPLPERDIGNFYYNSSGSFDDISNNIYTPSSSRGGGGCSSCGGGCSSCGGGCSSCGGGGGW